MKYTITTKAKSVPRRSHSASRSFKVSRKWEAGRQGGKGAGREGEGRRERESERSFDLHWWHQPGLNPQFYTLNPYATDFLDMQHCVVAVPLNRSVKLQTQPDI